MLPKYPGIIWWNCALFMNWGPGRAFVPFRVPQNHTVFSAVEIRGNVGLGPHFFLFFLQKMQKTGRNRPPRLEIFLKFPIMYRSRPFQRLFFAKKHYF